MKIVNSRAGGWVNFVQTFDGFLHVVPYRRQGSHDGRGAKAVGDHGEVSEMTLDGGVQQGGRVGVAQRRPVLVQQVHQLLADHSRNNKGYYQTSPSNQDIALLIRQLRNSWNQ